MALTFTIATPTGGTLVFAKMAMGAGRFCRDFKGGAPLVEVIRHHIRGVEGNITVRDARSALFFTVEVLYCAGTDQAVYSMAMTDAWYWAYEASTITDPYGTVFSNCNLVPNSFRIMKYGTSMDQLNLILGAAELIAVAQFTWDG